MKVIEKIKRAISVFTLAMLAFQFVPLQAVEAASTTVVINEVKTGGATAEDEFIELFNAGESAVSLENYKIAYKSATGSGWLTKVNFTPANVIPAKGYLLIAGDGYSEAVLADIEDSLSLAVAGGHLALKKGNDEIDKVGWGTADSPEGAAAVAPASGQSIERTNGIDTDNNFADFNVRANPSPKATVQTPSDTTAPTVEGVITGSIYYAPVTPCFSDNSNNVTATLNGESFVSCSIVRGYGNYELIVTDSSGNSVTVVFSIVDVDAPAIPTHNTPVDGAYITSSSLQKIDWSDVTDPSTPVLYQYEASYSAAVNPTSEFVAPVYVSGWLTASEISTLGTSDDTYYWHVRAKDNASEPNLSLWSTPWAVTVDSVAPVANELVDILTNKTVTATLNAEDNNSAAGLNYSWTEPTGKVVFSNANIHEAQITATEDGSYVITVAVSDRAGNTTSQTFNFVWDTKVGAATGIFGKAGETYVDLYWTNPEDEDLASIKVYRTLGKDGEAKLQATLEGGQGSFTDDTVIPGATYYYTLVSVDELGNEALSQVFEITTHITGQIVEEVSSPIVPTAAVQAEEEESDSSARNTIAQTKKPTEKEVKAATKEEPKEETKQEEASNLPAWGIALLLLIALLGLYLLWQQYPEMFGWLLFWKRRKKDNGNKLK